MNTLVRLRHSWSFVVVLLSALACNLANPKLEVASAPSAVAPPVDSPTAPFVGDMPIELPAERADQAGDPNSSANAARRLVSGGDIYVHGLYERPFNSGLMDKYFPYLDIVDTQGFKDDTWGYATITLSNVDPASGLPAQYAVELDLDKEGRGDWLIRVSLPAGSQWSTQGVQAWQNTDRDIGGVAVMTADSKPRGGNGYETLIFDQGQGSLTDGAWARIDPGEPRTVEIAFKLSMLGSPSSFAMGAWAGTSIDPSMFDHHDHMTHAEAGSPNPGYEVYPLKDLAEIDNTCRLAIGFAPTGKEPGLCTTVERREPEAPGPPPPPTEDPGPI